MYFYIYRIEQECRNKNLKKKKNQYDRYINIHNITNSIQKRWKIFVIM